MPDPLNSDQVAQLRRFLPNRPGDPPFIPRIILAGDDRRICEDLVASGHLSKHKRSRGGMAFALTQLGLVATDTTDHS